MWSLLFNNYPCNEKDILRTSQIHFEKLLKAKSIINNKVPKIPFFMKNKIYLKQFLKSNERTINIGNNIMYNKLFSAANCVSPYSKCKNIPNKKKEKTRKVRKRRKKRKSLTKKNIINPIIYSSQQQMKLDRRRNQPLFPVTSGSSITVKK